MAPKIDAPFQPIVDKFEAEFKIVGSIGNRLFVVTDLDAARYKIVEIDLTNPARDHWKEIVPESKGPIGGCRRWSAAKLVVKYLVDAKNQLFVFDLDGRKESEIRAPGAWNGRELCPGDPDRPELFYMFTSFLYPSTIYRYDVSTGQNDGVQKTERRFRRRQVRDEADLLCIKGRHRRSRCLSYARRDLSSTGITLSS